jgi:hypothetical protein
MSEHGESLTVLDPRMAEISPTRVVADGALKAKMRACGMRSLMRRTGLSQHTLEAVRHGRKMRHTTLQRLMTASS